MGFEIPGFKIGTQVAAADLTASRHRFVTLDTSGKVALAGTAGVKALGVLQSPAAAGEAAEVMVDGVTKVIAGAAIAATGPVTTDSQGRAITAAATHTVNGVALQTAAAAGEVIAVLLGYGGVVPTP